jgi:hypothetical protein
MSNPKLVSAGTPARTPIRAKRILGAEPELVAVTIEDDASGCTKVASVDWKMTDTNEEVGKCVSREDEGIACGVV